LIKDVKDRIGLERLRCLHLNDSKIELGGNRDRHANIDEARLARRVSRRSSAIPRFATYRCCSKYRAAAKDRVRKT